MDVLRCKQACMSMPPDEMDKCWSDCSAKPSRTASDATRYHTYPKLRPPPPEPEPSLFHVFALPGVLLLGFAGVLGARRVAKAREEKFWASVAEEATRDAELREAGLARARYPSIAAALAALRSKDTSFSWVLFEDFAHALYVEAHTLRGGNRLAQIKPFFSESALEILARYPANEVDAVIVGSSETLEVVADEGARRVRARLRFEANYTEHRNDSTQSYYSHEIWTFSRRADLPSRPPERARVIGCANCGAPLEKLAGERCEFCGAPSSPGEGDWMVDEVQFVERNPRAPQLAGDTEEVGTNDPTLVAPNAKAEFAELTARDPEFSWTAFVARVNLVFQAFHRSWSAQELSGVRPFLSDNLLDTQKYWIAAYEAQRLKNLTERPEIVSVALSRIVHDALYDAITVRVFAQCVDYTVDDSGRIVGGRRDVSRQYTEYWTFIRSAEKRGPPGTEPRCPSCGAPLEKIDMAGECQSCHVHVTSGEFDWVLSRIEQDEVYRL
jgi:predicted lipid-binding transport protein (Tim44 family)